MAKKFHCPLCSKKLEFFKSKEAGLHSIFNFHCSCEWKYKAYYHLNRLGLPTNRKIEMYFVGKYEVCRASKNRYYHIIDTKVDQTKDYCIFAKSEGKTPYFKTEEILEGFFIIK